MNNPAFEPGDEITIKPEHIKLLRNTYITWNPVETGAPTIDGKRPYGNSSVVDDIRNITEMPSATRDWCLEKHKELLPILQIWLREGEQPPGTVIKRHDLTWEIKNQ